jgi:HK97 family phage major capsid protein
MPNVDRIGQLKELKAEAIRQSREIIDTAEAEKRALSDEQKKKVDKLMASANTFSEDIIRLENLEKLEAGQAEPPPEPAKPPPSARLDDFNPQRSYKRYKSLRAFKSDEQAYRAGMWCAAALFGDAVAKRWVSDHMGAGGENIGTKGGFLVPEEMSRAIIDLRETYGVFRQEANVIAMASDALVVPKRSSGLTAYYVAENAEVTASDKAWDQVSLVCRKLGVLHKMSAELNMDAIINMADDIAGEIAWAFSEKEDDAGFNGDGTSTYGGIYGVRPKIVDGNHGAGAVDFETGDNTFAEVTALGLTQTMAALPAYALPNAKWYCSQPAFSLIFERLVAAGGGNTIDTLAGPAQRRYLGYPIVISQKMPTSTGDLENVAMVLFGDLRMAATMGDRSGFRFLTSNERYMEYDQIGLLGIERYDIVVHSLGDGTTAGPIVAGVGA